MIKVGGARTRRAGKVNQTEKQLLPSLSSESRKGRGAARGAAGEKSPADKNLITLTGKGKNRPQLQVDTSSQPGRGTYVWRITGVINLRPSP